MDEFNYNEYIDYDNDEQYVPSTRHKPTLHNSQSVNGPAMTIKLQLRNLRDKYDTLEQKAKTLELENKEYSTEVNKLQKENEELLVKNIQLSAQHTEIYDNKQSMANVLSTKSMELDKQHLSIVSLQHKVTKQQQSIKTLSAENNDLITANYNFKNRLEETVAENNIYFNEKQEYIKRIELLTHNIQELQHQLHIFSISIPDEEFKSIEQSSSNRRNSNSQSDAFGALSKAKTVRFMLNYNSRQSSYDDEHSNNKLSTRAYSVKSTASAASGTSYMGINEYREKINHHLVTHGAQELTPLEDSPPQMPRDINIHLTQSINTPTEEVGMNYDGNDQQSIPLGYDAASMHFDRKLIQLLDKQQSDINDLNDKYNELNDKYGKLENDYNEQKIKLRKRTNTVKELRTKNDDLTKKLASNKSCIVFDWFD